MKDLAIFRLADARARHSAARHEVIAGNVANADTPGYRARDMEPFSVPERSDFAQRATRPGHLNATGDRVFRARFETAFGAESPNGNNVALDDQMARASEARGDHNRAVAIYGKTMGILKAAIGRGR